MLQHFFYIYAWSVLLCFLKAVVFVSALLGHFVKITNWVVMVLVMTYTAVCSKLENNYFCPANRHDHFCVK